MAAEPIHCPVPGCDDKGGEGFANAGALRFHAIAKHRAAAGFCDECGKEFQNLASHVGKVHRLDGGAGSDAGHGAGAEPNPPPPDGQEADNAERPPAIPAGATDGPASGKPRFRDRVRSKVWGAGDTPPATPNGGGAYAEPTKEKRPKARGGRATTAPLLSLAWQGIGSALIRTGADVPVGRVLQFQGPMAGDVLDRLVARTWVDRLLQPLASKTDEVEALGALFALPVLIAVMERSPEAGALVPIVRQVIEANLVNMAPVVKRQKAEARKFAEAVKDLDLGLGPDVDPVDAILASIFAPPPQAPAPQEPAGDGATVAG